MWPKLLFLTTQTLVISDFHLKYLSNVLKLYNEFSYVIHADTDSLKTANYISRVLSSKLIFNNIYTPNAYSESKRPPGNKFVNIVLLHDPRMFQPFLEKYRNVILYDIIIFVIYDKSMLDKLLEEEDKFWLMRYIHLAGNVIVMNMTERRRVIVYNKCSFCNVNSLKFLENASIPQTTIKKEDLLPFAFDQFNGYFLLVAYNNYFPYAYCRKSVPRIINNKNFSVCLERGGSEAKLLQALSEQLNFTYALVTEENNSYSKIETSVYTGKVDFAIGGVFITYKRFLKATFTTNLRYQDISCLYTCRVSLWNNLKMFKLPFENDVWLLVIFLLIFTSICIHVFSKFSQVETMRMKTSIQLCMKAIIEQPDLTMNKRFRNRWATLFLIFIALFACLEINTAYKSKLSSLFVRPPHMEPSNADELIEDGYQLSINVNNYGFLTETINIDDPLRKYFDSRAKISEDICQQLSYITENRAAMVEELGKLRYHTQFSCQQELFPAKEIVGYSPEKLRITSQPVRTMPHSWMLGSALPFWKSFDIEIGKLRNAGFIEKWTNDALFEVKAFQPFPYSKNNTPEDNAFDIRSYFSPFIMYVFGNLIALITFAIETFFGKRNPSYSYKRPK